MAIVIDWHKPLLLTKNRELLFNHDNMPEDVPADYGLYYFSRKHGENYYPFYIGKTSNLWARLKSHLNSVSIVNVLRGQSDDDRIKQGARHFHFGTIKYRSNQDVDLYLKKIEKLMIQQAIAYQIPILNKNLTTIKVKPVQFVGSKEGIGWFETDYELMEE